MNPTVCDVQSMDPVSISATRYGRQRPRGMGCGGRRRRRRRRILPTAGGGKQHGQVAPRLDREGPIREQQRIHEIKREGPTRRVGRKGRAAGRRKRVVRFGRWWWCHPIPWGMAVLEPPVLWCRGAPPAPLPPSRVHLVTCDTRGAGKGQRGGGKDGEAGEGL